MSQRLIIYIDEHWPNQPACTWVLLDARDRVIEEGRSEPRHWPATRGCEVVIGGGQCVMLETRLPRSKRREQESLLRYALEERLVRDVEEQHLTVVSREPESEGVKATVLVIARARMRAVLAQLEAIGRRPTRMISELQTAAPAEDDAWALSRCPGGDWIVRAPAQCPLAIDAEGVTEVIGHLLAVARARGETPAGLNVHLASDHGPLTTLSQAPPSLTALDGERITQGTPHAWWGAGQACDDLLHGEFGRGAGASGTLATVRAPALLVAISVAALVLANLGEIVWKGQQLGDLEERMVRLFETSVPNTPAIAPAVQLQRALDDARATHGQLRQNDFLALLDHATQVGGAPIRHAVERIDYDDGTLSIGFRNDAGLDLALLVERLNALGHEARIVPDQPRTFSLARRALQ